MTTDNFHFYLQNRLIQTGQTGGQLYSDTYPFSVPWKRYQTFYLIKNNKRISLFVEAAMMKKRGFIALTPGVSVIKLFRP